MYRSMFDGQKRMSSLIMATSLLIVLIGIISKVSFAEDLCKTCKPFPDEERRDALYEVSRYEHPLSDKFIEETWYCSHGMNLTTSPPGSYKCGTLFPIWVKGEKEFDNGSIDVTVCTQIPGNKCYKSFVIKAKQCEKYKMYHLKQTASDSAYCLGAGPEMSPVPGSLNKPAINTSLTNVGEFSELQFRCIFTPFDGNLFYKIYWYVDSVHIVTSNPHVWMNRTNNNALDEATLREHDTTTVGFTLHCAARASYQAKSAYGPPVTSRGEFIGIKLYNTTVHFNNNNNKPKMIFFKLTAPFGCNTRSYSCSLYIEIYENDDQNSKPTSIVTPNCATEVKNSKWNQVYGITIKPRNTVLRNEKRMTTLKLTTKEFIHHRLWANYRDFGNIVVTHNENPSMIEGKECSATCDPYVSPFDEYRFFGFQLGGIFTLFINVPLKVEVQVESAPCVPDEQAYCLCGVAVRAGRSVFAIQLCRPSHPPDFLLCDDADDVLDVRRKNETYYEILIPSGAVVKVSIGTEFGGENSMNVFVFPSVHDVSKSGGLCGKLSNTVEGAFVLRNGTRVHYVEDFIKSWSVEDQNNLFNESTSHELKRWDSSVEYCSCPACNTTPCSEIQCGPMQEVDGSYKYRPHVRVVSNIKRCSIHARRKRSTVKPNLHQMSVHKRDTPDLVNDWTRENATAFCEKHFDLSSSAKMCLEIQTVNITKNIEYCVLDILASGSTEFLGAALDSMQTSCMHALVMNSTFHHKIEEESILDKFVKVTCPYGCSMKGDCADGVCRCHGNFSGSDCSVDISYPPKITDVEFEGLCDVNEDPCTAIALFGKTFVESSRTICRFRHLANENHTSDGLSVTTAHFQSLLEVACPIPVHRSKRSAIGSKAEDKPRVFYVSVSNNGVAYSEERIVVIYNSTCQTCTLSGTSVNCVTLEDYCTVGTQCIPEGGRYPFGECLVCDINGNERTWQEDPTCTSSCMRASAMWILTVFPAFIVYYML